MADYLLGVDIGTSSCKVAVFDHAGTVIASATAHYAVSHPAPGYAEQDPNLWWEGFCHVMKEITDMVAPSDISAIGVAGQSWSAISVNKSGEVLFSNPIWMDCRAEEICKEMVEKVPFDEIFALCGNPVAPTYTTPKILWFAREYPEVFKQVYKVLQSNSYFVYKLTGKFTQDISQGYGLHFFDIRNGKWDNEMAKSLGVCPDLMPELYASSQVVGTITLEAARATGLLPGTAVIAGGLDAACSNLGAGVSESGQAQAQGGTAGGMSLCTETPIAHPKLILGNHVAKNRWLLQGGTVGGGGVIRWLKESILGEACYDEMSRLAEQSCAGAGGLIFLPYMSGERSPIWDRASQGVFFGLDYSKSKKDIIRAAMEGVAFSLLHNINTAFEVNVGADSFNLVGGIANSKVWMQILSDVTGKPFCTPSSDTGTNLGAAILAGIGIGVYRDEKEAIQRTVRIKDVYEPNVVRHEAYQVYYNTYRKIYDDLKDTMSDFSRIKHKG